MSTETIDHPTMSPAELDDQGRFKVVKHVPILDVHEDKDKGDIDKDKLDLIAKNSNDRVNAGNPAALILGHTRRKHTIVVIRPNGSKIVMPATDEVNQPKIVGYAKNFHVDDYQGKDCLHVDWHIANENVDESRMFPHRSVERLEPAEDGEDDGDDNTRHYIDRIALLKTPPERDLGVLQYERDADWLHPNVIRPLIRTMYSRDFPSWGQEHEGTTIAPSDGSARKPDPPSPSAPKPHVGYADDTPNKGGNPPMPTPSEDPTVASEEAQKTAMKVGEMSADEFSMLMSKAMMNALNTVMASNEEPNPEPDQAEQYEGEMGAESPDIADQAQVVNPEVNPAMPPEVPSGTERTDYAYSEPSSGNVFTPSGSGVGEPKKPKTEERPMAVMQYEKQINTLTTELAEVRQVVATLLDERDEERIGMRRQLFERDLDSLVNEEHYILDKEDELAAIKADTDPEYEGKRLEKIRTMHARSAGVGNGQYHNRIQSFAPPANLASTPKAKTLSREQNSDVATYMNQNTATFAEACKALGI